jgi:hypothetical protein
MRRILLVMTVASVLTAMIVAMAMPAFADEGGVPNEEACLGQTVKTANQFGDNPHVGVEQAGVDNAGELLKGAKAGEIHYTTPEGEVVGCPPEG